MDTPKTAEEIIQAVHNKPQIPIKGDSKSFLEKWAVDITKPLELQEIGPNKSSDLASNEPNGAQEENVDTDIKDNSDSNQIQSHEDTPKRPIKKEKEPNGFHKRLKKEVEEAKRLAEERENEAKQLRDIEIPSLTKKISELEEKLSTSKTQSEFQATEQKLADAEKLRAQYEAIVDKNKELESKVEFYDLENSPQFQEKFVKPIVNLRKQAVGILGSDESQISDLTKALQANLSAMQSTNESERLRQENYRDELITNIIENLPTFKQARFCDVLNKMILAVEDHFSAIQNHTETKKQLILKAQEEQEDRARKEAQVWKDSYNENKESIDSNTKYPEEIERIIRSNKIDDSIEEDSDIAQSTIDLGMRRFTPGEITRLINQGRVFKKHKAYIQAQDILIKELKDTIDTLKGSNLGDSSNGTSSHNRSHPQETGLQAKFSKFSARNMMQ